MTEPLSVLIVEDDADVALGCAQALALEGIASRTVTSAEQAQQVLAGEWPGVIVSDVRLPGASGLELLAHCVAHDPELPIVVITGHGDVSMAVGAMRTGAYDFLQKPFAPETLVDTVRRALEKRRLVREVRALRRQLAQRDGLEASLIGQSAAIQKVRQLIATLAPSDVSVLVQGETGTGKERVARCLHDASPARHGHFVALNCGGMSESLLDSELFGHEAGAFTGAAKRRIGKLEYANGGTLFLDEIETMPLAMQVKLLRVLQERTLERLGSNTPIALNCRVIAATKANLLELADQGRFRADLYYRLQVATVQLPPLRERREDVHLLFTHFLQTAAARDARPMPSLSATRLQQLVAYHWPGNVRELRNVADRCVLGIETGAPPFGLTDGDAPQSLAAAVDAFEKSLLSDALRRLGSVAKCAEALQIAKSTLHDKMKRHGLAG